MSNVWTIAEHRRAAGESWDEISRYTGLGTDKLRRRLEPGYAEARNTASRINKAAQRGSAPKRGKHNAEPHLSPQEAAKALRQVPSDTRSHTARLMGDPLPGRSALERRTNP